MRKGLLNRGGEDVGRSIVRYWRHHPSMSGTDIGESLVGAYLSHIERCEIVVYNNFFPDRQGEIDVVGIKGMGPRQIFLCEVTTHIDGMYAPMTRRMAGKLSRLREFAETTFPGEDHHYQWWSPVVPVGALTTAFDTARAAWQQEGRSLDLVFNGEYTNRIAELIDYARSHSSTTSELAYRLLQVLTHMRVQRPPL